jgi:hypothetical protein
MPRVLVSDRDEKLVTSFWQTKPLSLPPSLLDVPSEVALNSNLYVTNNMTNKSLNPQYDEFEICFELLLSAMLAKRHACKTPPVEGASAGYLQVPYPGGANTQRLKSRRF